MSSPIVKLTETFEKGMESEVSHTHHSDPPFLRSTVVRYTSLVQEMSDPAGLRLRRQACQSNHRGHGFKEWKWTFLQLMELHKLHPARKYVRYQVI